MADLTRDDILKLAHLARLQLTDVEIEQFTTEISKILDYVEQLQGVDVAGLEPTNQVTGLTDVERKDEAASYGYKPQELLKNLPEKPIDNQIKVRRIL